MKRPLNYFGLAFDEHMLKDKRQKEWKKQRKEKGFDNTELWNLDNTIAQFIFPRLKAFKEKTPKIPGNLTEQEWNKILEDMLYPFETIIQDNWYTKVPTKEECKKFKKGLKLFSKYLMALWD